MCGACGAGSARSVTHHWSAPFLASVPARTAAARTLSRWSRATGWSGVVHGVAGGFEVATSSGRRSLAADLAGTLGRLGGYGVGSPLLLAAATDGVVEGPPTRPGRRPRASTTDVVTAPVPAGAEPADGSSFSRRLPPDPRRRYRVPGLLVWVAAAEEAGSLGPVRVHLGLGGGEGLVLASGGAGGVTCDVGPEPALDTVSGSDGAAAAELVALLGPAAAA